MGKKVKNSTKVGITAAGTPVAVGGVTASVVAGCHIQ